MLTRITKKTWQNGWLWLAGSCLIAAMGCNSEPAGPPASSSSTAPDDHGSLADSGEVAEPVVSSTEDSVDDELPSYAELPGNRYSGQAPRTTEPAKPGRSPEPKGVAGSSSPTLPADAPPEDVVGAFLEATRSGDEQLAAQMLTQKALEETRKRDLVVSPPGTPSMQYTIGEVEEPDNGDGLYVHSEWTDTFQDGETESFNVIWVLRQEPRGWRIAGMAAQMEEDERPLFLNFEQPDELRRRLDAAAQELASGKKSDEQESPPFDPGTLPTEESIRQAQQPAADSGSSPSTPRR